GIRYDLVTGVQTCALPISIGHSFWHRPDETAALPRHGQGGLEESRQSWLCLESIKPGRVRRLRVGCRGLSRLDDQRNAPLHDAEIGRASCRAKLEIRLEQW